MSKPEVETPEAWDLSRVRIVVQAVVECSKVWTAADGAGRHVQYHVQAGRILGWLSGTNSRPMVTPDGQRLLATVVGSDEERVLMRAAVANAPVVVRVVPGLLAGLKQKEIEHALRMSPLTGLACSTAQKRASTLAKWAEQVRASVVAPPGRELVAQDSRVLVVQLSDIHVRDEGVLRVVLDRVPPLVAALAARQVVQGIRECVLIFSGDLAFAGTAAEYGLVARLLDHLVSELKSRFVGLRVRWVFAPGNHDCNFALSNAMRSKLLDNVDSKAVEQSYFDSVACVQSAFASFAREQHERSGHDVRPGLGYEFHELNVGRSNLRVQVINTAWMSTLHERQGALVFPHQAIMELDGSSDAGVVISVGHHGFNWFEANNGRALRRALERSSDLIFTGHEHVAEQSYKSTNAGDSSWLFEGGVLYESSDDSVSTFNAVVLDTAAATLCALSFEWLPDRRMYVPVREAAAVSFQRNQYRLRHEFKVSQEFSELLDAPGEPYPHPRKAQLTLGDIFVYPDLRERVYERSGADAEKIIREPVDFIMRRRAVMLMAPELAGKTALARSLFKDLQGHGVVPLLLSGRELKDARPEAVHALIDETFCNSYSGELTERYRQLERSKRAIIVDDFHRGPLNLDARDRIAAALRSFADVCVVLVDETFEFAALRSQASASDGLWSFTHCSVLALGHRVRYDLVTRWCSIGRGDHDHREAVSREIESRDRSITHLIGQNFLPSYPSFVLLCLTQLEVKKAESNLGSFGHLYEALLTRCLDSGGASSGMDLDAKQQFLSQLAFRLFSAEVDSLDEEEFGAEYQAYCDLYHVRYRVSNVTAELLRSTIIEQKFGRLRFKYKYAYLFFVARYLRDHLQEDGVRALIESLCRRLHHESSSNTLLFLCHLSKDSFVLETLLRHARSLFEDRLPIEFDSALRSLGNPALRVLELAEPDHRENGRRERELRDQLEPTTDAEPDEGMPPELLQVSAAFRAIQILGQILRGFPGSIAGDTKTELARECYSLGLRTASAVVALILTDQVQLEEYIAQALASKTRSLQGDVDKRRRAARSFIYDICESFCFSTVKHISDAVGLQALSRTYEEVLMKDRSLQYRIVDLAILLDHFDAFPQSKFDGLLRDVGGRAVPMNLIRRLVWRRMYLFEMPRAQLQSVCSKLQIKVTNALKSQARGSR
jgi:hypothetical protein